MAHIHTHNCAASLIPSTIAKPYCTQQIISLVGGSMLQRSPVVCQGGSLTVHGVLCKTSNTLWLSCSLGYWRVEADWIEMERETVKIKCGRGFKKCINRILSLSLVSLLHCLCNIRKRRKTIHPRDHISSDPISFEMLTWHFREYFGESSQKVKWTVNYSNINQKMPSLAGIFYAVLKSNLASQLEPHQFDM